MKKAIDFFTAHPAIFFLSAAVVCAGVMYFINFQQGISWHEIFVEADGLVFDLLVFGILLSIYERLREKKDKIERLHEEIDDYRGWDEKEATFRIVGAVRRLNKLGVSNINLNFCFLQGARLNEIELQRASLEVANLQGANLEMAYLQGANLSGTNLQGTFFLETRLQGAILNSANLQGASLFRTNLHKASLTEVNLQFSKVSGTNLQGAILNSANLQGATIWHTNLQGAIFKGADLRDASLVSSTVDKDWFEKLDRWHVKGFEEIKHKYFIDEEGRLQEKQ